MASPDSTLSTTQVAQLLGVQVQTVYSYVSRGMLERVGGNSRHAGSRFDRAAVEQLAGHHRRPDATSHELRIDTDITYLDPRGRLLYRGRDATDAALTASFEDIVELLWQTTELNWELARDQSAALQSAELLPRDRVGDRIRAAVLHAGALHDQPGEPAAHRFPNGGVVALNAALAAVPNSPADGSIAERLAAAIFGHPSPAQQRLITAALIVLADHELATSTVAARATAGVGAAPYLVVLAGLSALGGPKHGQASMAAAEQLRDRSAASKGRLAGFGHAVYTGVDPRAEVLLDLLREDRPEIVAQVDAYALDVQRRSGLLPNVDLALAAMCAAYDLPDSTGETIFCIARIAGFVAHGLQEHSQRLRFRPRAIYTGPLS